MPRLSVVVPALNEADRLPPTLETMARYLDGHPGWLPAELVVVDDGSIDHTAAAAAAIPMPRSIRLRLVEHRRNQGKGAAVRSGFAAASGAEILLSDADLSAPIDQIEVLAAAADDGSIRIGSRAVDRSLIEPQPMYRDLMGRIFNVAVRTLLLPGIHDTQCGFKLFPGDVGRALAAVQRIDGFAFDVELLYLARRWGVPVVEVPVRWRHVEASRVRAVRHSAQMLRDLIALRGRAALGRLPDHARVDPPAVIAHD